MSTSRIASLRNPDQMRANTGHRLSPTRSRWHRLLLTGGSLPLVTVLLAACAESNGGRELYLESRANPIESVEVAGETRVVTWPWVTGDVGTFAALPGSGSLPLATRTSRAREFADTLQTLP